MIVGWGSTSSGELGLGGIEDENILLPREIIAFHGKNICRFGCGDYHTVVILDDGTVYSCGNNDSGQLGHEKSCRKFEQVSALEAHIAQNVSCGASHTMVINECGQIFSWGLNNYGQLGLGNLGEEQHFNVKPRLIKSLAVLHVVQVSCGSYHSMALTNGGQLFTWGRNSYGQLGLGHRNEINKPTCVVSLEALPIAQIEAGGFHSFILSTSGAVYGWGKNRFGQLGVSDEEDRIYPTQAKSLRYQLITKIACGEDHTAVLTEKGGVFTFGAGMYGQLGHNAFDKVLLPRQVFELMGCEVTQLVCGRRHTLAYVPATGRVYAFGLGCHGQLGLNSTANRSSPTAVKGNWLPFKKCSEEDMETGDDSGLIVKEIFCGGDHCFALLESLNQIINPVDHRTFSSRTQILSLDKLRIAQIMENSLSDRPELLLDLETIFSSPACLNNSFLTTSNQHYGCNRFKNGVDMMAVRNGFAKIEQSQNKVAVDIIAGCIERQLLKELKPNPPDMEALRLYLMLAESHFFNDPQVYDTIICPFAKALLSLSKVAGRVIDDWWSKITSTHFAHVVQVYKQCIIYILNLPTVKLDIEVNRRQQGLFVSMEMLRKLNSVNITSLQIIPFDLFYIPNITDKVDIRSEYISWFQVNHGMMPNTVSFCDYPFLLDAKAKTILLQTDAIVQMQVAVDEAMRRNLTNMFLPQMESINPCLVFYVTREHIVQDTISQLEKQASADLKKPVKVIFMGEEAVDAGGVRKEFFILLLRNLLDPQYGMFKYYEETRSIYFSDQTLEDTKMFFLVGVVCGLAIYNFTIIDISFPLVLYKKLLRHPTGIEDLKQLMPSVVRSLEQLLDYEGENAEDVFGLTFEITKEFYDEMSTVELIPGGSKTNVTKENRQEYVDAYVNYILNESVDNNFQGFSKGFHKVCGGQILEFFHPQELMALVVGNQNYNWDELEESTEYKDDYSKNHPTIKLFWKVFHELTIEEKKKFLMFLTGSDRIPILGMKSVKVFIQPTHGGDDYLPVAHTCFNLLDLPKYENKEKLRSKLLQAIQHTQGFGLA